VHFPSGFIVFLKPLNYIDTVPFLFGLHNGAICHPLAHFRGEIKWFDKTPAAYRNEEGYDTLSRVNTMVYNLGLRPLFIQHALSPAEIK